MAAIQVLSTGIIDFAAVCRALAAELAQDGAELRSRTEVVGVHTSGDGVQVHTQTGDLRADALVSCAGLHSDRIARMTGLVPKARIISFRGEYFELRPHAAGRIGGLFYPVRWTRRVRCWMTSQQAAPRQVHVLNAPSPAATSGLEIARYVGSRLAETMSK